MSNNPWHKRYHSDALSGYIGLTLELRGAYTTILDMLYDRGEPIVKNDRLLAGYMGVSLRKYKSLISELLDLDKIFITDDGRISNYRFEKERENDAKTSRKCSENGMKGARKKAENNKKYNKNNGGNEAVAIKNGKPISDTRSHIPDIEKNIQKRFDDFWVSYGKKVDQKQALDQWTRKVKTDALADQIIEAAKRYAGEREVIYRKSPMRWLRDENWNDEPTPKEGSLSETKQDFEGKGGVQHGW